MSAPASAAPAPSGFQETLQIINLALAGLAKLPLVGPVVSGVIDSNVSQALAFVSIIQTAQNAVKATTGKPIDLTLIPFETKV